MTNTYHLTGYDEDSNIVVELQLTADQAVQVLAKALNSASVPPAASHEPSEPRERQPRAYKKKKRGRPRKAAERAEAKPCCGSKGARHLKTCPVSKRKSQDFVEGKPSDFRDVQATQLPSPHEPLNREQYAGIRAAMDEEGEGFSAGRYALTHKLSATEVMTAKRSTDYEDYLAIR